MPETNKKGEIWNVFIPWTSYTMARNRFFSSLIIWNSVSTRKYPLRGYILGVLTHTTALDRLWEGDETLTMWFWNWAHAPQLRLGGSSLTWHLEFWPCGFEIEYTHLGFALAVAVWLGSEGDPKCTFFTHNTYLATFISDIFWYYCRNWRQKHVRTHGRTAERQTDVEVEIVI